ncbi:hypothetical protein ACEQPO_04685 [Bacillus sp. SL00103]
MLSQNWKQLLSGQEQRTLKIILDTAKDILGHETIEPADHFYQLGGIPIKAIQFIAKLKDETLFKNQGSFYLSDF